MSEIEITVKFKDFSKLPTKLKDKIMQSFEPIPPGSIIKMGIKNIVYSLLGQSLSGIEKHPEEGMFDLGIRYYSAEAQPIADQWIFYNCENIPEELPKYLRVIEL